MNECYKTKAVVLHTMPHGENGLVVYMYTEAWGRLSYYINSGKRGVAVVGTSKVMLHPLTIIDMVGVKSSGSFHRIREAKRAVVSTSLFGDIYKSTISLYMAELIYKVVKESEPNAILFDFLFHSIKILDIMEEGKVNFHLFFTVQLTKYLGFFPQANYEKDLYLDMKSGNFVIIKPQHTLYIDREESALLYQVMSSTTSTLGNITTSGRHRSELLGKMIEYIGIHHDTKYSIKSLEYLREIF